MFKSPEINQLDLLEEHSRERIALHSSSTPRGLSSSMQPRQLGRIEEIVKQDLSADDDNSEIGTSALLDEEYHCVTAAGKTTQRLNNHYLKQRRYERDLTNEEDDLGDKRTNKYQSDERHQSSMSGSSSSSSDHLKRSTEYRTVPRSFADNNQHSEKTDSSSSNQTTSSTNYHGVDERNSNTVARIQTSKRWVPVTPEEYRNLTIGH